MRRHAYCVSMLWHALPFMMAVSAQAFETLDTAACAVASSGSGVSLLQARSGQTSKQAPPQPAPPLNAKDVLPPHLYALGIQLLGSEDILEKVVVGTDVNPVFGQYAGEAMTIRMVKGDSVDLDDSYGLDSIAQLVGNGSSMMNMLDIGGNYGRVTIAAWKKHPEKMRIITVEPIPSTYLILRWNLWLNGIPELTLEEFQSQTGRPGVVVLHNGLSGEERKVIEMCYTPPETMGARFCNCSNGYSHKPEEQCVHITGLTIESLIQHFGNEPITLLKMDCEGCEADVIPGLKKLEAASALHVSRFAGELHAMPNDLEEFACAAEGGKYFVHVCFVQGQLAVLPLPDRCQTGAGRASCSRIASIDGIPPSEWFQTLPARRKAIGAESSTGGQ